MLKKVVHLPHFCGNHDTFFQDYLMNRNNHKLFFFTQITTVPNMKAFLSQTFFKCP